MKIDADGSNTVEMNEWIEFWLKRVSQLSNPLKQQEIIARNTFERFDVDGSNTMDATEFSVLVESLGADFTDEEIQEVVRLLDTDKSGTIDGDEFVAWWTQRTAELRFGSSSVAIKLRKLASKAAQRFTTDVFASTWNGEHEIVKAFLSSDSRACSAMDPDNSDWTALHCAAYTGDLRIAEILIAAGANVNKANAFGFTPVFYAAQSGHVEMVSYLIDNGADCAVWGEEGGLWMCPLDHVGDTPGLRSVFGRCSEPLSLSECTTIKMSVAAGGLVVVRFPLMKTIAAVPVRTFEVKLMSESPHYLDTFTLKSKRPSDLQEYSIQLKKGEVEGVVNLVKEGKLKCTAAAVDAMGRKGDYSPLIEVVFVER
jgi:hypothetical protein